VSSALDTSVGLAAGVRLAAALDDARPRLRARDGAAARRGRRHAAAAARGRDARCRRGRAALVLRDPVPSPPAERIAWLVARAERALAVLGRPGEEQGA
jgi:hypothetical protein